MKIGFIGTGTMAGAMLKCALERGFLRREDILVYDKNVPLMQSYGVACAESAADAAAQCDVIQLGVKPQDQPALLEAIAPALQAKQPLVISIAAGVALEKIAPYASRAARLMPNINTAVGQGMTAWCATQAATAGDRMLVADYCACFGQAIELDEKHFSAFCALAGSGPAYVFLFMDELARAGVTAGLPKALALEIAAQTVLGSAVQVQQSTAHPYELLDRVCSPGGTTIAGINALREHGFAHAVSQAVLAAQRRDQALGR